MFQCVVCTAAQGSCSLDASRMCVNCGSVAPHLCARCLAEYQFMGRPAPVLCYLCSERPHVCLSACVGGCKLKARPDCNCGTTATLRTVKKEGKNKGKKFWSCFKCGYFLWD